MKINNNPIVLEALAKGEFAPDGNIIRYNGNFIVPLKLAKLESYNKLLMINKNTIFWGKQCKDELLRDSVRHLRNTQTLPQVAVVSICLLPNCYNITWGDNLIVLSNTKNPVVTGTTIRNPELLKVYVKEFTYIIKAMKRKFSKYNISTIHVALWEAKWGRRDGNERGTSCSAVGYIPMKAPGNISVIFFSTVRSIKAELAYYDEHIHSSLISEDLNIF